MRANAATRPSWGLILRAALAGLAYWGALALSYRFGWGFEQEADIWLASGVAIGVLTVADSAHWPYYTAAIALGALIGNIADGASFIESLVYAVHEIAVALLIAWLLRRLIGPVPRLDDARKVLLFAAVGALGGAVLSWAVAIGMYALLGHAHPAPAWRQWIVSCAVGTLIVAPLIWAWSDFRAKRSGGATMSDFALGGTLFVLLIASALLVFGGETAGRFSGSVGFALTYLPFAFLVLGALVWGVRGATLSTLVLAVIAVLPTRRGEGPFAGIEGFLGEGVLEVQGFLAAAALLAMLVTALDASRQHALREAAEWKLKYESVIDASDQLLYELDPVTGRLSWAGDVARLLGVQQERVDSLADYLEHVHPDDRERTRVAVSGLSHTELHRVLAAHRFVPATGEQRQLEGESNAIVDFDDTVHRIVGFLRPVRLQPTS
jgi:integral membrane sensor domain MASE1